MKTQINKLISGRKNVIRPMEIRGIIIGSSGKERAEIAKRVNEENENGLLIRLMGMEIWLRKELSCSGKTITYIAELSEEDYMFLMGITEPPYTKALGSYYIMINADMSVDLLRANEQRVTYSVGVAEEMIEIL